MKNIITQSEILSYSLIEAHKRGLPKGWTVSFNNHHRKRWTSPLCNDDKKRSFDSIPSALNFIKRCELGNYYIRKGNLLTTAVRILGGGDDDGVVDDDNDDRSSDDETTTKLAAAAATTKNKKKRARAKLSSTTFKHDKEQSSKRMKRTISTGKKSKKFKKSKKSSSSSSLRLQKKSKKGKRNIVKRVKYMGDTSSSSSSLLSSSEEESSSSEEEEDEEEEDSSSEEKKGEMMAGITSQIKAEMKREMKGEMMAELINNLREGIKKDLMADFFQMKKDLRDELWTSMREQKKDLRDDLTHDLKKGLENISEVLMKDLKVDLIERLRKDREDADKELRDDISNTKRTAIDEEGLKAGDVRQNVQIKVENTTAVIGTAGIAIKKCENSENSTKVALLTVDIPISSLHEENEKLHSGSSFLKKHSSSFVHPTANIIINKNKAEKETTDAKIEKEEKVFEENVPPLSSTLTHHYSYSDSSITMTGYRYRYERNFSLWEKQYLDLIEYKSMHGNCDVSKDHSTLLHCVFRHRQFFESVWSRSGEIGVDNIVWLMLTPIVFDRLNNLGFKWRLSPSNDPTITTAEYKVKYNKRYIAHRLNWNSKFLDLSEYKLKHGDCHVPNSHPLASWLNVQTKHYTLALMTPDQEERLNSLGIDWTKVGNAFGTKWYSQYDALYSYQLKHGNTNIPQSFMANPTLSTWVTEQRFAYNCDRLSHNFSTIKMNLLNEMHFCWDEQKESLEEEHSTWAKRFSELVDYKVKHGNCNVPNKYPLNTELESWVKHQRFLYELGCQNKHPLFMNSKGFTKLKELGFSWRRYDILLEDKHEHSNKPLSKKRNLDTCNTKEKSSHKKNKSEKKLKKKKKL